MKYLVLFSVILICSITLSAEVVQVTTNGGYHPRFSPDGSKIAYTSVETGEPQLFMITVNGDSTKHFETGLSGDYQLCWTPDGSRIIFDAVNSGPLHIYSIPIVSNVETRINIYPIDHEVAPRVTPDGLRVSFKRNGNIYYAPIGGGTATPITADTVGKYWHEWAPDGNRIAYDGAKGDWTDNNFDIYTIQTGGEPVQLTDNPARDYCPTWTPDGKYIVFSSNRDGDYDLYMIPDTGGTVVQITDFPGNEQWPDISPDGTKIVFGGDCIEPGQVYIMDFNIDEYTCGDTDGSGALNILDIVFIIAFLYQSGPSPEPIESADADGSGQINILDITYLIAYLYQSGPDPQC